MGKSKKRSRSTESPAQAMQRLNVRCGFFDSLRAIEHPRFIMQYRRKEMDRFAKDYLRVIEESMA